MSSDENIPPLPEIDFSNFVLSLATTAMMQLGVVPNPETGESAEPAASDLLGARQMIDILDMLREKTRGNLNDQEEQLLDSMLYDLRMRAVEKGSGS